MKNVPDTFETMPAVLEGVAIHGSVVRAYLSDAMLDSDSIDTDVYGFLSMSYARKL